MSDHGEWIAKCPGALGNALGVDIVSAGITDSNFNAYALKDELEAKPGTSQNALDLGLSSADEMHVIVYDRTGAIAGSKDSTKGTVLEVFQFMSQASDAKSPEGSSIFYKDVINAQSKYIRWAAHSASLPEAGNTLAGVPGGTFTTVNSVVEDFLTGGLDGTNVAHGEVSSGLDLLKDASTVDVNLLSLIHI